MIFIKIPLTLKAWAETITFWGFLVLIFSFIEGSLDFILISFLIFLFGLFLLFVSKDGWKEMKINEVDDGLRMSINKKIKELQNSTKNKKAHLNKQIQFERGDFLYKVIVDKTLLGKTRFSFFKKMKKQDEKR